LPVEPVLAGVSPLDQLWPYRSHQPTPRKEPLALQPLPFEPEAPSAPGLRRKRPDEPRLPGERLLRPDGLEPESSELSAAIAGAPEVATKQLVVFELAGVAYGLEIGVVESIIKMQPITAVPHAHPWVEGVTNLRGTVLPVINLRQRFGLPAVEAGKETRIMVGLFQGEKVGLVVDAVSEVMRVSGDEIEPAPPVATHAESAYIVGIAKTGERFVLLLDFGKVLSE
jgi:purine-binding chemotaxis protein CheW